MKKIIEGALFGVAVGDALGVPVEFKSRRRIAKDPVTGMRGYGTYDQSPGTWSDDSSLTFCLAEALTSEFDLHTIRQNFVRWYRENFWTPHGEVFDIGITTATAIGNLEGGQEPHKAGPTDEYSNGNGSLMRILPLLFYIRNKPLPERFSITHQVSSITHGHIRSAIACFYYLEFARHLLDGKSKFEAYQCLRDELPAQLRDELPAQSRDELPGQTSAPEVFPINPTEIAHFDRLLKGDIHELPVEKISSSGYVIHALEASIWCLLTTDGYAEAVLKAVNLGEDTDTTGAITGGLAGLLYGMDAIPEEWLAVLARREDIEDLAQRVAFSYLHAR